MATQQPKDQKPAAPANTNAPAPAPAPKLTPEQALAKKTSLFKELAPKRTRSVLKALEILANCGNRSGYNYTDEQVNKIFSTIESKVAEAKRAFSPKAAAATVQFTLD